jgi:S1/P1 Nuclease
LESRKDKFAMAECHRQHATSVRFPRIRRAAHRHVSLLKQVILRMLHPFMQSRLALAIVVCVSFGLSGTAKSYGPIGHQIVGAIADERLANTNTGKEISTLLDGVTLEKASVIADEIKGWDKNGVDDPRTFHYSRHPQVDTQLRDFCRANPPTKDANSLTPSHHWFHYTDVPLVRPEKYQDGTVGRSRWDVVHMISYCVDVLRGRTPETNERKITKPVAVILLAHFVGDIHQPLHVGAQYFDRTGNVTDPDKENTALADEGGNTFTFEVNDDPDHGGGYKRKFHAFWDLDCVNALLPSVPQSLPKEQRHALLYSAQQKLARELASQEPRDWRMPSALDPRLYSESWANEILPVAREAHQRVLFRHVAPTIEDERLVAAGDVAEKPGSAPGDYRKWASEIVREELHKAGWRLADLLEKSIAPENTSVVTTKTRHD